MTTFFSDWFYLSIRSTKQIWRPLLALIPSLFIPVFFFVVNSASLSAFSRVPGFPNVSYRDFISTCMQSSGYKFREPRDSGNVSDDKCWLVEGSNFLVPHMKVDESTCYFSQ